MTKIGRNEKCPCRSGKKYKHCCINKKFPLIPKEGLAKLFGGLTEPFGEPGVLTGRPFIETKAQGKRARAVGSTVYMRPIDETFQQFILLILVDMIGKDFLQEEAKKPENEKHSIRLWYDELQSATDAGMKEPKNSETHIRTLDLTGNLKSLLGLAWDMYTLKHCNSLPLPRLMNRLRNKDGFQGAKYEIAVAAMIARAGFDIAWKSTKDGSKQCEFIARDKSTGVSIGVEAKSHHRSGVLQREGKLDSPDQMRIKIGDHVKEALEQVPQGMPFLIFSDLNIPLTPDIPIEGKRWFDEVKKSLKKAGLVDSQEMKQVNALIVTNFSWHFSESATKQGMRGESISIVSPDPSYPLSLNLINMINLAGQQYGYVPPRLEEIAKEE